MSPSPRCFCPAETKRCRTAAARVPARLQNTKSLERRRRACEERKGRKLQSLYLLHFCCRGLTLSCARGRSLWLYNTGSPVGDKYHTATLSGPLFLGCYSNKEAIVVRSPQLKCCTASLKIPHVSGLGRNPPPSSPPSNENAALPATDSPAVPPAPSGFKLSTGATPIYHSSQSRAGASQRSSPPSGRLSRQADRFIHRSHVAEAEKDFSPAPASTTERGKGFGERAR